MKPEILGKMIFRQCTPLASKRSPTAVQQEWPTCVHVYASLVLSRAPDFLHVDNIIIKRYNIVLTTEYGFIVPNDKHNDTFIDVI